jgi:hypothetical protein
MVTNSTTEVLPPAPVQDHYVRRTQQRTRNGSVVSEETTESGSTTDMPGTPPVQSSTTRSTSETIAPR